MLVHFSQVSILKISWVASQLLEVSTMQFDGMIAGNMTSISQPTDTDCYRTFRVASAEKAAKQLTEDKNSKEDDVEFSYEMQQAREKDKERLKNDKTFWEFVKEGEEAMQIPEKKKWLQAPSKNKKIPTTMELSKRVSRG